MHRLISNAKMSAESEKNLKKHPVLKKKSTIILHIPLSEILVLCSAFHQAGNLLHLSPAQELAN